MMSAELPWAELALFAAALLGAGVVAGVMRTLLAGGPAGIDRYPDAPEVLALLLPRTGTHRPWLEHYLVAADVRTWLLATGPGNGIAEPGRQPERTPLESEDVDPVDGGRVGDEAGQGVAQCPMLAIT